MSLSRRVHGTLTHTVAGRQATHRTTVPGHDKMSADTHLKLSQIIYLSPLFHIWFHTNNPGWNLCFTIQKVWLINMNVWDYVHNVMAVEVISLDSFHLKFVLIQYDPWQFLRSSKQLLQTEDENLRYLYEHKKQSISSELRPNIIKIINHTS